MLGTFLLVRGVQSSLTAEKPVACSPLLAVSHLVYTFGKTHLPGKGTNVKQTVFGGERYGGQLVAVTRVAVESYSG